MSVHSSLKAGYVFFFVIIAGLSYFGRAYYPALPLKKYRLPLRSVLTSSGSLGHPLGILGTFFIILLLAYSLRKRLRFMRNWGNLNVWLEIHIFLGLTGPILVFFHSDFRFSGLVGLCFWSMALVVISGIIGRYIYQLIPHSLSGMELNRIELEADEIGLTFELRKWLPRGHPFWNILTAIEKKEIVVSTSRSLFSLADTMPLKFKLRKALRQAEILSSEQRRRLLKLILRRQAIIRRGRFLERTMRVLHYWHLFHIPVVILMFMILIVHVYAVMRMGYRWIF